MTILFGKITPFYSKTKKKKGLLMSAGMHMTHHPNPKVVGH